MYMTFLSIFFQSFVVRVKSRVIEKWNSSPCKKKHLLNNIVTMIRTEILTHNRIYVHNVHIILDITHKLTLIMVMNKVKDIDLQEINKTWAQLQCFLSNNSPMDKSYVTPNVCRADN